PSEPSQAPQLGPMARRQTALRIQGRPRRRGRLDPGRGPGGSRGNPEGRPGAAGRGNVDRPLVGSVLRWDSASQLAAMDALSTNDALCQTRRWYRNERSEVRATPL